MKKRFLGILLMLIMIIISIMSAGCSSKATEEAAPAAAQSRADYGAAESNGAGSAPGTTSAQASNRKLIVKINMKMRVDDIEKSIFDAEAMAATAGGYTSESYQTESSGQLTLMIPAGNIEAFTENIIGLGKIINSSRKTEDVTDSYFDTQIRVKNLEAEIGTLRELLQKPGWKVSEILEIEREIRRLTDELESLKGFMTNLDRRITYSEVSISFVKSQMAVDSDNQDSLGYKLMLASKSGANLLIDIVTAVLRLIAFILPISPFAAIAYFVLRKPLRRLYKKSQQNTKE